MKLVMTCHFRQNVEAGNDDDVQLLPPDPDPETNQTLCCCVKVNRDQPTRRERAATDASELDLSLTQSSIHCSHRQHFKFAFNLGLFVSIVFLMLEGIYAYDESAHEQLVIYLWVVRVAFYYVLTLASLWSVRFFTRHLVRTTVSSISSHTQDWLFQITYPKLPVGNLLRFIFVDWLTLMVSHT